MEFTSENRLEERFNELTTLLTEWSKETLVIAKSFTKLDDSESVKLNLKLIRTIVSKWSLEILAVLRTQKPLGFVELRKSLNGISSRVLSEKLKMLENSGLIERKILNMRPPGVRYALTGEGQTLTSLGAPVILYLRFRRNISGRPRITRRGHRGSLTKRSSFPQWISPVPGF